MCVIVDEDVAAIALVESPHPDFLPVVAWLLGPGKLVCGIEQLKKLQEIGGVANFLVTLARAGRLHRVPEDDVARETGFAVRTALMKSNDSEVIGVARASGARTLCTRDKRLMADFKNRGLVPAPKGRIYKGPRTKSVLIHASGCPGW